MVIGGGYAGTLATNRLHQFVARTGGATIDYGTLLGEGAQPVVDSAVQLASGRALDYDTADGAVRPGALTIWAAGFGVPKLAAASWLRTDTLGRLPVHGLFGPPVAEVVEVRKRSGRCPARATANVSLPGYQRGRVVRRGSRRLC